MKNNKVHDGYNIKRIREILGIKQEKVAAELGGKWNQQRVSILEQRETINRDLLDRIAKALNVTTETIKAFSDDVIATLIVIITTNPDALINLELNSTRPLSISPVDKLVELYERIIEEKEGEIRTLREALSGMPPT